MQHHLCLQPEFFQLTPSVFQPYLIGVGALITILLLILHRLSPIIQLRKMQGLPKQVMIQNIFLLILFFNYLAIKLNSHLDAFELIAFFFAIWILKRWGSVFYNTKMAGWMHPTTHGTFFVVALLNGCALVSIFNLAGIGSSNLQHFLHYLKNSIMLQNQSKPFIGVTHQNIFLFPHIPYFNTDKYSCKLQPFHRSTTCISSSNG